MYRLILIPQPKTRGAAIGPVGVAIYGGSGSGGSSSGGSATAEKGKGAGLGTRSDSTLLKRDHLRTHISFSHTPTHTHIPPTPPCLFHRVHS